MLVKMQILNARGHEDGEPILLASRSISFLESKDLSGKMFTALVFTVIKTEIRNQKGTQLSKS